MKWHNRAEQLSYSVYGDLAMRLPIVMSKLRARANANVRRTARKYRHRIGSLEDLPATLYYLGYCFRYSRQLGSQP
jgi:hypothetical protein